ncbi:MAG: TetR/AcrR family transcriptional regulator [Nitratireductor sp.]|uniref:TetR/AcrR family transcriptional regulator n=1 Tax=Alphaproteobacteria TaxID=28211 RepID=UPI00327D7398
MKKRESRVGPGRPPTIKDPVRTICDAAASLIAEKGYDTTSLQDVAKSVGVTKAGLYHYFPTKQALFETIVLDTLEDLYQTAATAIAAEPDHRSKLIGFMSAHAAYFSDHGDRFRASFFGRGGGEMANYTPEQLAARKAYTRLLEKLLEEGVRDKAFVVADIPTFARGILGMLNWMARWFRPDGPQSAPEIARSYASTILDGIAKD